MAGYLIVQNEVSDAEAYEAYKAEAAPTVAAYGGEYVVRGGEFEVLEGAWSMPRTVIIRFPSVERARAWYNSPEYAAPKAVRQSASSGNMIIIEGA